MKKKQKLLELHARVCLPAPPPLPPGQPSGNDVANRPVFCPTASLAGFEGALRRLDHRVACPEREKRPLTRKPRIPQLYRST